MISRAIFNKSGTVAVKASAVECSIKITSLLYAGSAIRNAEGKIMQRYILNEEKP
ncbi:hypothetical protein D3C81_2247280 [compost metagenome]